MHPKKWELILDASKKSGSLLLDASHGKENYTWGGDQNQTIMLGRVQLFADHSPWQWNWFRHPGEAFHWNSCKKSGIFVLHEPLGNKYLFCCCLGFDAALLQQSISPQKDRALANLTWERWKVRGDISPLSPSCNLISARMTYWSPC